MTEKALIEKWKSDFEGVARFEGYETSRIKTAFGEGYLKPETQTLWEMYRLGRRHERCAAACALAQKKIDAVVSSTDWQSVNAVARAIG